MTRWLSLGSMAMAAVGIFVGFYFWFGNDQKLALAIVTTVTVGVVGLLAFLRHFVFHKADAARMGWETDRPEWAYEVGFANLAFGVMGLVSVAALGVQAQALALLGYAVYLAQAAALHGYQYAHSKQRSVDKLWRVVIGTASFAAVMAFFAVASLVS